MGTVARSGPKTQKSGKKAEARGAQWWGTVSFGTRGGAGGGVGSSEAVIISARTVKFGGEARVLDSILVCRPATTAKIVRVVVGQHGSPPMVVVVSARGSGYHQPIQAKHPGGLDCDGWTVTGHEALIKSNISAGEASDFFGGRG